MTRRTRREAMGITGAAVLAAAAAPVRRARAASRPADTIVVGAGVFGAWTARHLQRMGHRVLMLDAWAPAHARASSGGESRLTRGSYGADRVYTDMALESLGE